MATIENVSLNGIRMSYARFGEGKKVFVILPGLSATKITPNARAVERQYLEIAKNHTVYLFDRRDDMPTGYTNHAVAEDTAAVMKHLGIEKVCLHGVSQGGMIALDMAINHPELVSELIMCVSCAYINDSLSECLRIWRSAAEAGDSLALNTVFVKSLFTKRMLDKVGKALISAMPKYSLETLKQFIIAIDSMNGYDLRSELKRLSCPVYVIGAENDTVMGRTSAAELANLLNCEYFVYPEYGHGVYDEAPDFAKRLAEYLSRKNF